MDRKQKFGSFVLSMITLLVVGIVSSFAPQRNFNRVDAEKMSYSISFSSTSNKFVAANTTQEVLTTQGNQIVFSYSGYSGALGKWGNLAQDGYIANQTALSGLASLSVFYGTATGDLAISYGWWDSSTSSIVYEVTDGQISSTSTTFMFDGYGPSFVKIKASAAAQIASMTLTYYCEATENPFPAFGPLEFTLSGSSYSVTYCDTTATSANIPSTYKGLPVTSLGDDAFKYCDLLTSVTIPSSITVIGYGAFYGCRSLTSIIIPNSVTSIGDVAFYACTGLTSITLSSSLAVIGWQVFCRLTALTSITIPSSVTSIGNISFSNCSSLTYIIIPSSVTQIGSTAFNESLPTNEYSTIYFGGTPAEWTAINFTYFENNGYAIVYYSEAEHLPDTYFYWHYDVDSTTPLIWGV